jgi:DNA helicase-2/ATP-dependent DNA helicase PcrA
VAISPSVPANPAAAPDGADGRELLAEPQEGPAAEGVTHERHDAGEPAPERGASLFERAWARDVVAWVRLLSDPTDAAAVVRVLGRPPIEMRQVDIARAVQLARKRKLDLVGALPAALESPKLPPEARERIERFLALHEQASAAFDALLPRLRSGPQELAAQLTAVSEGRLLGHVEPSQAHPDALQATIEALREEVLGGAVRVAGRLGELRLDTDLDISHGVVRYLELVKLAALKDRPPGQSLREALDDINARLLAACTPLQREIFQTSTLDEALLAGETPTFARREEPTLEGFIPKRGEGLVLSASDIETYRACPLRYKLARVLKVPSAQTLGQRFGIAVHQVLERYHTEGRTTLAEMLALLDRCWQRGGFGESEVERELHGKARLALARYHERLEAHEAEPVWFERQFVFKLGPHHIRGRVDRVDRLPEGGYELIDYKTSRPRSAEQLAHDVQLSLYAVGARESWDLNAERLAYYYVLDDEKVPVPSSCMDPDWIAGVVQEAGAAIAAQRFEPTPSPSVCAMCDYRIACPAGDG